MRPLTRQDHIDPLVLKVQKCHTPGCRPHGIMVLFQIAGYTKQEFPVWVCSSGHCSDYEDLPNLRKPEDDPYAWLQKNARELMNFIEPRKCVTHEDPDPLENAWGQEGHLWSFHGESKLCLPRA